MESLRSETIQEIAKLIRSLDTKVDYDYETNPFEKVTIQKVNAFYPRKKLSLFNEDMLDQNEKSQLATFKENLNLEEKKGRPLL